MNVYIVTSGDHSDYIINRVFLNEDKAKEYVKFCEGSYGEPRIEVYKTSDDKVFENLPFVDVTYIKRKDGSEIFELELKNSNTLDDTPDSIKNIEYFSNKLNIRRAVNKNISEKDLRDKYLKACRNLMTQIETLERDEENDYFVIIGWLLSNSDKYIPDFE